jgi:uncharacterized protein (TIGR04145 family)
MPKDSAQSIEEVMNILRVVLKYLSIILLIITLVLLPQAALAANGLINIDGYYDDWADKPHTSVSYDDTNVHNVAFLLGDDYLYGHIKMNNTDGRYFPKSTMYLIVNDEYYFILYIDFNVAAANKNINNLQAGSYLDLSIYDKSRKVTLGNAAITIYGNDHVPGDDIEFSIDLNVMRKYCNNIPVNEMQSFTLGPSNLGSEELTIAGTSTAPLTGLIIIALALTFFTFFHKQRKAVAHLCIL